MKPQLRIVGGSRPVNPELRDGSRPPRTRVRWGRVAHLLLIEVVCVAAWWTVIRMLGRSPVESLVVALVLCVPALPVLAAVMWGGDA